MHQHKVERLEIIDYEGFYKSYLVENRPCVFAANLTAHWRCRKEWLNADGTLNLCVLRSAFGECEVPVTDCVAQKGYGSFLKSTQKFGTYLDYLQRPPSQRRSCLYLKDWHFQRVFPNENAYEVPVYFSSDWLNEWCDFRFPDAGDKDYKFLYLGPKGSWTPFHEDVLQSFSWSSNICGRKKWMLFPPGAEKALSGGGEAPTDISDLDISGVDHVVCIQEAGETIFVPSGWHHQVWNLEDTLSVNHNWINAASAPAVLKLLKYTSACAAAEIADVRGTFATEEEWISQCQALVKCDLGMNMEEFVDMLLVVKHRRLNDASGMPNWLLRSDFKGVEDLLAEIEQDGLCIRTP